MWTGCVKINTLQTKLLKMIQNWMTTYCYTLHILYFEKSSLATYQLKFLAHMQVAECETEVLVFCQCPGYKLFGIIWVSFVKIYRQKRHIITQNSCRFDLTKQGMVV